MIYNLHSHDIFFVNICRGTENNVLETVRQSQCQLEEIKFLERTDLALDAGNILRFLQSQSKTLKRLDLSQWLKKSELKDIEDIFKEISQMKRLEILCIFILDLIKGNQTSINKFHRLMYFNKRGLSLYITSGKVSN